MEQATPFDPMARNYDAEFTYTTVGQLMRTATWKRLDVLFAPGDRVLELNCGTGEDAVRLGARGVRVLATDVSSEMVAVAAGKVAQAGLSHAIEVRRLGIEELGCIGDDAPFDGALSNFGGLNCVADLTAVARQLARVLRPGASAILCVMGPAVPWEWAWFLAQQKPDKAFRRLRREGIWWRGMTIRYPTIARVRKAFSPYFKQSRVSAVGALLPPSYAGPWAERHPRLLDALARLERRIETCPPLPSLADHYLIELQRTGAPAHA